MNPPGGLTVVVRAHPLQDCFVGAAHERVLAGLARRGDSVMRLDLYADGHRVGEPLLDHHREALAAATRLVLVYPTWNSGQPAILLDWLLAARGRDLAGVAELTCVTTHGGGHLPNIVIGRAGRHTARRVVLPGCAPGASFHFVAFYGCDRRGAADRQRFLEAVERRLAAPAGDRRRP